VKKFRWGNKQNAGSKGEKKEHRRESKEEN
jgi:hypothetical protein